MIDAWSLTLRISHIQLIQPKVRSIFLIRKLAGFEEKTHYFQKYVAFKV
jgi:hypothetical protein